MRLSDLLSEWLRKKFPTKDVIINNSAYSESTLVICSIGCASIYDDRIEFNTFYYFPDNVPVHAGDPEFFIKLESLIRSVILRYEVHTVDDCSFYECTICSVKHCPFKDELHTHHDGCPSCIADESRRTKTS